MVHSLRQIVGVSGVLAAALLFMGCSAETGKTGKTSGTAGSKGGSDSDSGHDYGPGEQDAAKESEDHSGGPELSAEDQTLASAQKLCPVSDDELGSMGNPIKEMVQGEPVFLCCKGCIKKLHANEEKYLARVAELKKGSGSEGGGETKE